MVSLRGDWAIFYHVGSGPVGRVWSARDPFANYFTMAGNWAQATRRTQWGSFILSPGSQRGQTVRYIHSPTELSRPTRATERTDSEIHSFSQWAIMTGATERTDSEIHSFSHWAIMTRATERTDSEIHSFSYWAIMTLVTERTDSEIHSFSHWAIAHTSSYLWIQGF